MSEDRINMKIEGNLLNPEHLLKLEQMMAAERMSFVLHDLNEYFVKNPDNPARHEFNNSLEEWGINLEHLTRNV
jgi:hypothetical protein